MEKGHFMEEDPYINISQPTLFSLSDTSLGTVELFPAVWSAVEELASPEASTRQAALDRLQTLGAPRLSPLVAYMVATRIDDPDLPLRARIIRIISILLSIDDLGRSAPEPVQRYVIAYLTQMRMRPIYAILQAALEFPYLDSDIARLLNSCPYAGNLLADILVDRKISVAIRREAARYISEVGYLDAIPVLERLESRLATRMNGQQYMPFAPPQGTDERELLPVVQSALAVLRGI
jgi:hypothetical protein